MTTRCSFFSDGIELEGISDLIGTDKGVVITHPHPLYGGDMYNPVVNTIAEAYALQGYSTLRFNFRGVGGSGGSYDDGRGEVLDVLAGVSYLKEKGIGCIDLAGYSFGTWVIARTPTDLSWLKKIVMVSPPVAFMDMPVSLRLPGLHLVVSGDMDDIAPAELIRKRLPNWNAAATLEVIKDADHFYGAELGRLQEIIRDYI